MLSIHQSLYSFFFQEIFFIIYRNLMDIYIYIYIYIYIHSALCHIDSKELRKLLHELSLTKYYWQNTRYLRSIYIYLSIYIYVYIKASTDYFVESHSSVWLPTRDTSIWDRNRADFTSVRHLTSQGKRRNFFGIYSHTLSATGMVNSWEELCINGYLAAGSSSLDCSNH